MLIYKREFILNIFFLFLANLLIKPYYIFFIERDFQNQVGTSTWGIYFTLFSLSMVPQILLDFGMTSYVNRKTAAHRSDAVAIWKQTYWLRLIMALVFLVAFLALSYFTGYLFTYSKIVFWIALNQFLLSTLLFIRAYISGLGHYRTDSLFSISDKLLFIVLILIGRIFLPLNQLDSFLVLQFISLLLPVLTGLVWIGINLKTSSFRFIFSNPLQILRECLPYIGIFLFMVLFCRMEPVWIDLLRIDGAQQSGIYAASYRLLDAANMLGFLFAGILLPMFSHSFATTNKTNTQSLFDLAWQLMTAGAIWIAIPMVFYHDYIMNFLYTEGHGDILYILMFNLIPLTINYLLSTLLTAVNRARHLNRLFLVSILINVVCHLIFTSKYGAQGAAISALITQSITSLMVIIYIQYQEIISIQWRHIRQVILIFAIMIFVGMVLSRIELHPAIGLLLFFSSTLLVLFSTGLIPIKAIYQLLVKPKSY